MAGWRSAADGAGGFDATQDQDRDCVRGRSGAGGRRRLVSFARAYLATWNERVEVIVLVLVLAGLPVLAHRLFGPADRSRTARALRVCAYAAILALIPARNVLGQILDVRPRAGLDLRVYRLVDQGARDDGILFLAIVVLYAVAILWLTSKRSRVAPASLTASIARGHRRRRRRLSSGAVRTQQICRQPVASRDPISIHSC